MGQESAQMEKIRALLQGEARVTWAYLFGSRATGTAQAGSDWDIAVWPPTESAPERLSICFEIQAALMEMLRAPADVVDLRGATLLLSHEVLKRRVVLVDREPLTRSRHGVVETEFLPILHKMAQFRNLMVHQYVKIEPEAVYGILRNGTVDFDRYARFVASWLTRHD